MRPSTVTPMRQAGVTLIELLVSLVIGLVLMVGVVSVFVANRETYNLQEELAHLQENGRFAIQMLERDLMAAGYRGCKARVGQETDGRSTGLRDADQTYAGTYGSYGYAGYQEAKNALKDGHLYELNFFSSPINGFDSAGSSSWAPALASQDVADLDATVKPLADSDILTLRLPGDVDAEVVSHPDTNADLTVINGDGIAVGDIVLVSDCTYSAVLRVTKITNAGKESKLEYAELGLNPDLGNRFDNKSRPGRVTKVATRSYFVRQGDPADGTPTPALWRLDDDGQPQELVEGIEMLQIDYGLDTDTNPDGAIDTYLEASAISNTDATRNWSRVLGVRVSLLLRSMDDVLEAPQGTMNVGTVAFVPADNFLRKVFSTTLAMRNLVQ